MSAPLRCRSGIALTLALAILASPALAQAHNPFSVGISEGGGNATGLMGWIMSQQGTFERSIAAAVRGSKQDGAELWVLMGLSFLYGVLHAAGPGHGKAVLASYMVANERALRRGIVLSFAAALLQAGVAIAVVLVLSRVVHATAIGMRNTAAAIETLSYVGITLLGCWLVWRKGSAFRAEWAAQRTRRLPAVAAPAGLALAGPAQRMDGIARYRFGAAAGIDPPVRPQAGRASAFTCEAAHEHGPSCGHVHAPDPSTLGDGFSWQTALTTVVAAGARPCSGAILVMVFALSQGILLAGIASTLVMALGTALTTAALAATAVLAKSIALRLSGPGSGRGLILARGLEVLAALLVLAVGLSLLFGVGPLQALA